jgi:H/ACA ribonucleoprotein complex subunit 4
MNPEILVKAEATTDPAYGCEPEKRELAEYIKNGVINLDKPCGPTSHQATAWVRDILEQEKAGHSGTLDPKVTGVLPVTLGNATKIVQILLLSEKEYVCLMSLHDDVPKEKLINMLKYFQAKIFQTPPLKSAVKRELRIREIYKLEFIEKDKREAIYRVECEAGTYIRKLCHDIGLLLGTGAHMQELRRTKAGSFTEEGLVKLQDVKDAMEFYKENKDETYLRKTIQPVERAVKNTKKIWVKDSAISAVCHGANLNAPGISKLQGDINKKDMVAIMSLKNELVAIARAAADSQTLLKQEKGVAATLERVMMDPDTYPVKWNKNKKTQNN